MNCKQAQKYIVPFLDGELEDAAEFSSHVNTCEACRQELMRFQRSFENAVLRQKEQEHRIQPSRGFLAKLNGRIDEFERQPFGAEVASAIRRMFTRERMAFAGWIAALVLLSISLGRHVKVETVSYNPFVDAQYVETRIELRLGDSVQIPLVQIIGN